LIHVASVGATFYAIVYPAAICHTVVDELTIPYSESLGHPLEIIEQMTVHSHLS